MTLINIFFFQFILFIQNTKNEQQNFYQLFIIIRNVPSLFKFFEQSFKGAGHF